MRNLLILISLFFATFCYGQTKNAIGTFSAGIAEPKLVVVFKADSTFEYTSATNPFFYNWEGFSEKGKWTISADTIILNPTLEVKPFVESDFQEQEVKGQQDLLLAFNHIKRYFDKDGNLIKADTLQIRQLDYAFNELKKKKLTRIAQHRTTRCTFAGYIPKEIITTNRNIQVSPPTEELRRIFIGCYELQGIKEFAIKNPNSNHLTLNVYSNYYQDGQIRKMKFLMKNENVLYTKQKPSGEFEKDNAWTATTSKLKRQKDDANKTNN